MDSNQLWQQQKRYGANAYRVEKDSIMVELYKNGPVEVDFDVFEVQGRNSKSFLHQCSDLTIVIIIVPSVSRS